MPCLILSIDGGGLRGIIPVLILKHIEQKIQASTNKETRLVNYFNLISGTSTGGLIACGLSLGTHDDTLSTKYSLEYIESVYRERGSKIFPPETNWFKRKIKWIRKWFRPQFAKTGIEEVLLDIFDQAKIRDCIRPIVITTYDISCNKPFYFSSRKAMEAGAINYKLTDVCRATSAGPTYLPAHGLQTSPPMICVDGGVFQNNPTITGLVEVLKHPDVYNNGKALGLDEIFVLSVGTGRFNKIIPNRHAYKGGQLHWARPMIDISMWGNSQAVDEHMSRLFLLGDNKRHYLRLNVQILEEQFSDMAIASSEAMAYYTERFKSDFVEDREVQADLDQWLIDSGILKLASEAIK